MLNILLAIHLIIATILIVLVLMQRSEGGGLGIGGGGNNGKSASLGKLDGLQRATWGLGAAFFATSIVLTIIAANVQDNNSIIDQLDGVSAEEINSQNTNTEEEENEIPVPTDPNAVEIPQDPNSAQ